MSTLNNTSTTSTNTLSGILVGGMSTTGSVLPNISALANNPSTIPYNIWNSSASIPHVQNHEPNITIKGQLIHDMSNDMSGVSFQHEIAVLKVTRNESGKIIRSKMIKTFWVETLTQGSIEYTASKDEEVSKFEPEEIIIKTLRTIKL
jgi:hypothetical protein